MLAALEVEASALARRLTLSGTKTPRLRFWQGEIEDHPVLLIVSGVGKVAAAMATQFVCDVHRPRSVLSIGLAGGIESKSARGRLIVASGAAQHDFDARPLTGSRGSIAGLGLTYFPADPNLSQALLRAARRVAGKTALVRLGVVLTGDQIITSREMRDGLLTGFPDGACFDMETAAVAHVAYLNGVPWGGLRVTSDSADESFDLDQVLAFGVHTAGDLFESIIRAVLKEL